MTDVSIGAIAPSAKHFFFGFPCKHGHTAPRFVSSGACVVCEAHKYARYRAKSFEKRSEYNKAYRIQNIERITERQKKLYSENKEERIERSKTYYVQNKERVNERQKTYRSEHREKIAQYQKAWCSQNREHINEYKKSRRSKDEERERQYKKARYAKDKEKISLRCAAYYVQNRDQVKRRVKAWRSQNEDIVKFHRRKRRALRMGASGSHTPNDLREILHLQKNKCAHCRIRFDKITIPTLDHIIALSKGGTEDRRNLQFLCGPCNSKKNNLDPIDFARREGLLL